MTMRMSFCEATLHLNRPALLRSHFLLSLPGSSCLPQRGRETGRRRDEGRSEGFMNTRPEVTMFRGLSCTRETTTTKKKSRTTWNKGRRAEQGKGTERTMDLEKEKGCLLYLRDRPAVAGPPFPSVSPSSHFFSIPFHEKWSSLKERRCEVRVPSS